MADPIVTIKQGQLKGLKTKDFDGQEYYKFLGLPYAQPPVGSLRFKAPRPAKEWIGIRDATKEGDTCYTVNPLTKTISGSEDCLYLNVYTRHLPGPGLAPKPVMVHFHGGAFTVGSGTEEFFGTPDYLMTGDIVFVNLNYRLGILGFLTLEDPSLEVPGNAGLKDQRQALKWVKENIANFNGDPNNVTIFGISAGGASVHFQMLSESCKGLFHKAISQSGTALSPWAWGSKNAIQLASILGEEVNNEKDALDVLMEVDVEKLFDGSKQIKDDLFSSHERRPFSPVVEKPNPTAFLTKSPAEIMKSGDYIQVPLIIGFTSNEGLLIEAANIGFPHEFSSDDAVPWYFNLQPGSIEYEELKNNAYEFYFKDGETDEAKQDLYSDVLFISGVAESIKLQKQNAKYPIYFYNFDANTPVAQAFYRFLCGGKLPTSYKGACHGNDALYIFRRSTLECGPDDIKVMRNLIQLWTSFAKSGTPKTGTVTWEPVSDVKNLKALRIDTDLSMTEKVFHERILFWEKQFKKYQLKFD